ncbi:UNVERIFIED_CONTAM: hypothetical protein FKN15_073539, partial [Acipenser sinensis]
QQLDVQANKYRIGVSQFSDDAQAEVLLNTFKGKNQVLNHIKKNLVYKAEREGELKTGVAIKHAYDVHFKESSGSRRAEGIPQFLVIITSGSSKYDQFQQAVTLVKKHGVKIVPIGVQNTNMKEWEDMGIKYFNLSADNLIPLSQNIHNMIKTETENQFKRVGPPPAATEEMFADVVFLVDGSKGMGDKMFRQVKTFLNKVVQQLDVQANKYRIGVSQFSDDAQAEVLLNTFKGKNQVLNHIKKNLVYKAEREGELKTGVAIKHAYNVHFKESSGSRRAEGIPQFLVIITSGSSKYDQFQQAVTLVKKHGVKIVPIGVQNTNMKEWEDMGIKYFNLSADNLIPLSQNIHNMIKTETENQFKRVGPPPAATEEMFADVVFLVDGSKGMGDKMFRQVKTFLNKVVQQLDVQANKYRIGVSQFSDDAQAEVLLNTFKGKNQVLNHIKKNLVYKAEREGELKTGVAIKHAYNVHFKESSGSRRAEGIPQFLVIITSGSSKYDQFQQAVTLVKKHGVKIVPIGVQNTNMKEWEDMGIKYFNLSADNLIPLSQNIHNMIKTETENQFKRVGPPPAAVTRLTLAGSVPRLGTPPTSNRVFSGHQANACRVCASTGHSTHLCPKTASASSSRTMQPPRTPPRFSVCQNASVADIVFLVQHSSNIGMPNFHQIQVFLYKIVYSLNVTNNTVRVGLVMYSNKSKVEFYLTTYTNKTEVLQHIKELPYVGRTGDPNTGAAIDYVRQEVFTGNRSKGRGVQQIAVLITDKDSSDNVSQAATDLRRAGVKVFIVRIQDTNTTELRKIASDPPQTFISTVDTFLQLSTLEEIIQTRICDEIYKQAFITAEDTRSLKEGCAETEEADIYFLMDGSGSIKPQDFLDIKKFLIGMVGMFNIGPDNVRIGAVQYATSPILELNITHHSSKIAIQQAIQNIRQVGGGTHTGEALRFMLKCFQSAVTTRPTTVPRYLVTLTDGESQDEVRQAAQTLWKEGVLTYAIGVKDANKTQLQEISGSDDRFFYVYNFDSLKDIKNNVVREICSQEACKKVEADIIFLIDSSGSIVEEDFKKMKHFVENIVKKTDIGIDKVRIGAIQFSDTQKEEFTLNTFSLKTELLEAIRNMSQLYGGTLTGEALSFTSKYFEKTKGGRSDVDQFLIVITDGEAQDEVADPAKAIRNKGITVLSIGVFGANDTQLVEISGSSNTVFFIESYDALSSILNKVVFGICNPQKACKKVEADIIFLIDSSGSIIEEDFKKMKHFVENIVKKTDIGIDKVRIGAIQFSDTQKEEFTLNTFSLKTELLEAIRNMSQLYGGTLTGEALSFTSKYFEKTKGGRSDVDQFLIVITDGEAQDEVADPAKAIRNKGITVLSIGVFGANDTQLVEISGSSNTVFFIESYDALSSILNKVVFGICNPQKACKKVEADIIFLIDSSGSIIEEDFKKMKHFVENIVKKTDIGIDKVRIGAIQFSDTQKEEFTLNTFSLKTELLEAIRNMSQLYGGTLTGEALSFTSKYFEKTKGGRSDVDQFLIVITDGEAQDEVADPAKAIRNKGITVLSIGVFGANDTQLVEISGSSNTVFFIESYDALSSILNKVVFGICNPQKDCEIQKADIVFLIDGSTSISSEDFKTMKKFLTAMVINFDIRPNRVQIGVAQYSDSYEKLFYLRSFSDISTFQNQIENISQLLGDTHIANALKNVKDFFTRSAGSRKSEGVEQILVVITDGVAQDKDYVYQAAEDLRQDSITIYALGIGNIDVYQLIEIAGTPERKFMVNNFNELETFKTRFVRNICEGFKDAKCAIDIAVGFDITSQKPGQKIFYDQHKLQVFLPEILKEITSLQTISCASGSQIQISFGFTNSEPLYETQFKTFSPDIVTEISQWVVKPSYLNKAFLESLWKKLEKSENKTKVLLIFTDGLDDAVEELKNVSEKLRMEGDEGPIGKYGPKGQKVVTYSFVFVSIFVFESSVLSGSKGSVGRHGHPGEEGTPGVRGIPGQKGIPGPNGPLGERGDPGLRGDPGVPGANNNIRGPTGEKGKRGLQGLIGRRGPLGSKGEKGVEGEKGAIGPPGFKGPQGEAGDPGDKGQVGMLGPRGVQGSHGDPGNPGVGGPKGIRGRRGPKGPKGTMAMTECELITNIRKNCHTCNPNPSCHKIKTQPSPVQMDMDVAFLLDSSRTMSSDDFERSKEFLHSVLDQFVITNKPRTSDPGARVALVQHAYSGYTQREEQNPVNLEFDFVTYSRKKQMKRHIKESLYQLQSDSGVGHAVEWTINNLFSKLSKARSTKVIFAILGGDTSFRDKRKLAEIALNAKCQGFTIFTLTFGGPINDTELEQLASFPFSHHSCQLGKVLDLDMDYALKFTHAFFSLVASECNSQHQYIYY